MMMNFVRVLAFFSLELLPRGPLSVSASSATLHSTSNATQSHRSSNSTTTASSHRRKPFYFTLQEGPKIPWGNGGSAPSYQIMLLRSICVTPLSLVAMEGADYTSLSGRYDPLPDQGPMPEYGGPLPCENMCAEAGKMFHLTPFPIRHKNHFGEVFPHVQHPNYVRNVTPVLIIAQWFSTPSDFYYTLTALHYWTRPGGILHLLDPSGASLQFVVHTQGRQLPSYIRLTLASLSPLPAVAWDEWAASCPLCFPSLVLVKTLAQSHDMRVGPVYPAMQHVKAHYLHSGGTQGNRNSSTTTTTTTTAPEGAIEETARAARVFGIFGGRPPADSPPRALRVLFALRSGNATRTILNLPQVLQFCNALAAPEWPPDLAAGLNLSHVTVPLPPLPVVDRKRYPGGIACSQHTFGGGGGGGYVDDLRVASAADVMIGVHGSQLTNAFFMQPGTALVEVFPPDFVHAAFQWVNNTFRRHLLEDNRVYSFWIVNHRREHGRPGIMERRRMGDSNVYVRDQHVVLDLGAVAEALSRVLSVRSPAHFLEMYRAGQADVHVGTAPLLTARPAPPEMVATVDKLLEGIEKRKSPKGTGGKSPSPSPSPKVAGPAPVQNLNLTGPAPAPPRPRL